VAFKSLTLVFGLASALFAQAPVLVGISPDTAVVGANPKAFEILVYGSNFQPGAKIFWNNIQISNQLSNSPLGLDGSVSPQLVSSAGAAQITVRNPDGTKSNAVTFTIRTTPATPSFAGATTDLTLHLGQPQIRQLLVVGSGIQPGVVLSWNGLIVPAEEGYPFLGFEIPTNLWLVPGPVNLTLRNPGGSPSNVLTLIIPPPRTLTSVTPSTISPGGGDVTLTVNGTGFQPGDFIVTGRGPQLPTQFVSSTQLRIVVPASQVPPPGTYLVTVFYVGATAGVVPLLAPDFLSAMNAGYVPGNLLALTVGPPGCSYSLSAASGTVGSAASTGSVQVITQSGCAWTASSPSNAVSITAPAGGNGSGNGTVNYGVKASNSPQSVTLTIAGVPFTVNQVTSCLFGLTPASTNVAAAGASGNFAIGVTQSSCSWTATSNAPWLQILSGGGGTGNGTVNYSVLPNASNVGRVGTITAGGQTFTVIQAGNAPCAYSLLQASQSFAAAGGPGTATVQTPAGCSWQALSNVQWLTVGAPAGGSGNGTVSYSVAANPGTGARTGSLTIAGLTYSVTQAGTSSTLSCSANAPAPPQVALEGRTELVGDLQLSCTGLSGTAVADISLALNTDVTNTLTGASTTDAVLVVNEANPQTGQLSSYGTIRWPGVTLVADSSGTATARITNVRVDASLLTAPANLQSVAVTGLVSVESQTPVPVSNAQVTVANAAPTVAFQTGTAASLRLPLVYQEATPAGFQPGTRLRVVLSNIAAGDTVFVPVYPSEGASKAQLYSADANGAGGSPVTGVPLNGLTYQQLAVTNGTATATWVVLAADPTQLETRTFLLLLGSGTESDLAQIQATGSLGPVSPVGVASATAPVPRYRDFSAPQKLVNLRVTTTVGGLVKGNVKTQAGMPVPLAGSNVTFTTQVVNDDSVQTATNVTVRDNVSTGGTIVSCTASNGQTCATAGGLATVTYSSLAPGSSVTVTAVVAPGASLADGSVVDNDVGVTSDDPNASLSATSASTSSIVLNGVPVTVGEQPASGSGSNQAFTFQFSHPDGYLNLGVVNVLVNKVLDGRNACYLAYSVPASTLYLVDDGGDAGGPYAGAVQLGSPSTIQNSQCAVSLASAVGSGTTLTLTLNIAFQAGFGGNRIFYVAAQDFVAHNTNWQALGVWQAPFGAPGAIAVGGLTPGRGSGSSGTSQQFQITVNDTKGAGDIGVVNVLINNFIDGRNACYLAYATASNTLFLVDDAGDAGGPFAGSMVLNGGNAGIQNGQCSVNGSGSSVSSAANQMTLTLNISFTAAFAGNRVVYVAGRDRTDGNNTDWQALGTFTVQ